MKRAWPYALALAVVVTGCYLLLAPLLRSLSPSPTTSASQLSQVSNSTTVAKALKLRFVAKNSGKQSFVSNLKTTKKAKKAKKPVKPTLTTGFANNTTSTSSGSSSASSSSSSTPSTPKTATKTPSSSSSAGNRGPLGGKIDQSQVGAGFAGQGNDGAVTGGQTLTPGN